jgi:hypothetical protein
VIRNLKKAVEREDGCKPGLDRLRLLADVLKTTFDWLVDGIGPESTNEQARDKPPRRLAQNKSTAPVPEGLDGTLFRWWVEHLVNSTLQLAEKGPADAAERKALIENALRAYEALLRIDEG